MNFSEECFDKVTNVDEENISGFTIRKLICERGSERLEQKLDKYGFVGLDSTTGDITTFHIKSVPELIKKAPSLGFER